MGGKNSGLLSKMILSEVKMPLKCKIVLFLGFWMVILGIFWQHFWAIFVPAIFAFSQKWHMPLEIHMNISLFSRTDVATVGNQQELPRFTEVGPYTFRQETIHEEYARNYVIRPRFDTHYRKKFYCIANCSSLQNDTVVRLNFEDMKFKDGISFKDTSSPIPAFMWKKEKALNLIFSVLNLQLVSLASNIDIFDEETVSFDNDHNHVAFNATGICRTVALFADGKQDVAGIYGDRFIHNITDPFYLSCRETLHPIHASVVDISIVVEPILNYIISATYEVQFNLLVQYNESESSRFLLPLVRIHQEGSMDAEPKRYLEYHRFVIILSEHYSRKILIILGLLMIVGTMVGFWKIVKNSCKRRQTQIEMQELETFTGQPRTNITEN